MNRFINIIFFLLLSATGLQAQELNANVTVNSDRIQTTNKNIFTTLERALSQFINGRQWSSGTFSATEKIDCTFSVTILEQVSEYNFKAELFVQARRPVYNSSYVTTIFNWRDTKFEFEYMENAPVEMNQTEITSNLVATIAFYANLILAMDFDSFSSLGGALFLRQAQSIASQAQSSSWSGWAAFDDNRSKAAIINVYLDESMKPYRELWYTYHRKGLDEMAANPDRGRITILNGLPVLKEIKKVRDSEIILQMFADCKLDETVSIAGKASSEEKKETSDLLRSLFPSMSDRIEPLKN
ncbi:MAG: DUF4835 family protein [Dysgonamonadaceae bacterium]|jgi:hypothetical protein|nr:DUF4835 family protein [Dysgonamonadaceae bacterium]